MEAAAVPLEAVMEGIVPTASGTQARRPQRQTSLPGGEWVGAPVEAAAAKETPLEAVLQGTVSTASGTQARLPQRQTMLPGASRAAAPAASAGAAAAALLAAAAAAVGATTSPTMLAESATAAVADQSRHWHSPSARQCAVAAVAAAHVGPH